MTIANCSTCCLVTNITASHDDTVVDHFTSYSTSTVRSNINRWDGDSVRAKISRPVRRFACQSTVTTNVKSNLWINGKGPEKVISIRLFQSWVLHSNPTSNSSEACLRKKVSTGRRRVSFVLFTLKKKTPSQELQRCFCSHAEQMAKSCLILI
jgi:hypothetical protein